MSNIKGVPIFAVVVERTTVSPYFPPVHEILAKEESFLDEVSMVETYKKIEHLLSGPAGYNRQLLYFKRTIPITDIDTMESISR